MGKEQRDRKAANKGNVNKIVITIGNCRANFLGTLVGGRGWQYRRCLCYPNQEARELGY